MVRAVAGITAMLASAVFLALTGLALILGFTQGQFHWVFVIVPGAVLVIAVGAAMVAMKPLKSERFPELKAQIDSDAQALRTVS